MEATELVSEGHPGKGVRGPVAWSHWDFGVPVAAAEWRTFWGVRKLELNVNTKNRLCIFDLPVNV